MFEAYFILGGRMRRFKFLIYSILLWIVAPLLGLLGVPAINNARYPVMATIAVVTLLGLFWTWSCCALVVKRLHDLERSGWHCVWIVLVPALLFGGLTIEINGIPVNGVWGLRFGYTAGTVPVLAMLYLVLARGSDGPNKYGYPP